VRAVSVAVGGAAGAAAAFLRSLAFAQRDDPDGADLLAPSVPGLLASSLNVLAVRQGAIRRAAAVPSDVIRREGVLSFLRAHLADPDLDADEIARGCYLSKRTLYRLFEGTEGSVMGRLRQLRIEKARQLLRRCPDRPASAIGREFGYPLLRAIAPLPEEDLRAELVALEDAGLVRSTASAVGETFAFKHALVQEVAYQTLLRSRRREARMDVCAVSS